MKLYRDGVLLGHVGKGYLLGQMDIFGALQGLFSKGAPDADEVKTLNEFCCGLITLGAPIFYLHELHAHSEKRVG